MGRQKSCPDQKSRHSNQFKSKVASSTSIFHYIFIYGLVSYLYWHNHKFQDIILFIRRNTETRW